MTIDRLCGWLLLRLIRRARRSMFNRKYGAQQVERFDGSFLFWRFTPFWPDEYVSPSTGKHWSRPPWWRPFNILMHQWCPADHTAEEMHDHPRWSVTLCLRGRIIEHTPWGDKVLTPGSFVFRSRKYIHSFSVPAGYSGKTWTVFVVGRRNHEQNTYVITSRPILATKGDTHA